MEGKPSGPGEKLGSPGLGLGPLVPLGPLTPALFLSANLAGDFCGHDPAEPGHWPGSLHSLLPAARGGPNAVVSQPFLVSPQFQPGEGVSVTPTAFPCLSGDTPGALIALSWSFASFFSLPPSLLRPHYSFLGQVPDTDIYRDVAEYSGVSGRG